MADCMRPKGMWSYHNGAAPALRAALTSHSDALNTQIEVAGQPVPSVHWLLCFGASFMYKWCSHLQRPPSETASHSSTGKLFNPTGHITLVHNDSFRGGSLVSFAVYVCSLSLTHAQASGRTRRWSTPHRSFKGSLPLNQSDTVLLLIAPSGVKYEQAHGQKYCWSSTSSRSLFASLTMLGWPS